MAGGAHLKTLADLDRESTSTYSMTLVAEDGGNPPLADSVRIEVIVQDVNDIAPMFSVDEYRIDLFEDADYLNFITFHVSEFSCCLLPI